MRMRGEIIMVLIVVISVSWIWATAQYPLQVDYDINEDGILNIEDWSAFGTRLQEQPEYEK